MRSSAICCASPHDVKYARCFWASQVFFCQVVSILKQLFGDGLHPFLTHVQASKCYVLGNALTASFLVHWIFCWAKRFDIYVWDICWGRVHKSISAKNWQTSSAPQLRVDHTTPPLKFSLVSGSCKARVCRRGFRGATRSRPSLTCSHAPTCRRLSRHRFPLWSGDLVGKLINPRQRPEDQGWGCVVWTRPRAEFCGSIAMLFTLWHVVYACKTERQTGMDREPGT